MTTLNMMASLHHKTATASPFGQRDEGTACNARA